MTKMENVQRNLFEQLLNDTFEVAPELAAIDEVLSEDERLLDEIKEVFDNRSSNSRTLGRHSVAVESIVRLILIKHIWDRDLPGLLPEVLKQLGKRLLCFVLGMIP